ncbi:hypothetical protein HNY73_015663 [Argiope bruennichi]|uniref:Uncharacterized protein n=1 Tax=Argiope bruennichi TaxID=94029 RepID=A0A8T0EH80_ARGBR|nr:hypothetical protein HNY73_015663 [Argiope bruennichi]
MLFPNLEEMLLINKFQLLLVQQQRLIFLPTTYPRPGPATVTQAAPQPQQKIGIRPQASFAGFPGGKLTPAQQAKLRAEAFNKPTFLCSVKTGKPDESVSNMLSQNNKNNIQGGGFKMPLIIQKKFLVQN